MAYAGRTRGDTLGPARSFKVGMMFVSTSTIPSLKNCSPREMQNPTHALAFSYSSANLMYSAILDESGGSANSIIMHREAYLDRLDHVNTWMDWIMYINVILVTMNIRSENEQIDDIYQAILLFVPPLYVQVVMYVRIFHKCSLIRYTSSYVHETYFCWSTVVKFEAMIHDVIRSLSPRDTVPTPAPL